MIYRLSVLIDRTQFRFRALIGVSGPLERTLGIRINDKTLFETALSHKSVTELNYERLEFLGDAVLQSVVSDYIYKQFNQYKEGALTVLRSKIVRRKHLNTLASDLGLEQFVRIVEEKQGYQSAKSRILGDTLEAIIGAIYLDSGYYSARYFILNKLFSGLIDLEAIDESESNYKGRIIEWSQRQKQKVDFYTIDELRRKGRDYFVVGLKIDGNLVSTGEGFSKRSAEHIAAHRALDMLHSDETKFEDIMNCDLEESDQSE